MGRAEVLGRERRRTWSDEDKLWILAEADTPEISLASVARRHDLYPQQFYTWRRLFREAAEAARAETPVVFPPVELRVDVRMHGVEVRLRPNGLAGLVRKWQAAGGRQHDHAGDRRDGR